MKVRISIRAVNGWQSKVLVVRIANASFSVMTLKSLFLYSLFMTRPCFTRKATHPLWSVERSFLIVSYQRCGNLAFC